jgi:hypothetical protein
MVIKTTSILSKIAILRLKTVISFLLLATPFNTKNHQQATKFNTQKLTNMNFATPSQQHSLPSDQWTGPATSTVSSNHLAMQAQSHTMNNMQPMTLHPQQSINNK